MMSTLYTFYMIGIFSLLAVSIVTYRVFLKYDPRHILYWLPAILIVSSFYMLFAQYLKYRSLHFYIDFSSWAHLLNNIAFTGKPLSLNEELLRPGCINYFSAHFVPLVYILALPFKLWPYSETVIIMNFLLMTSSAIPLYKLAINNHKDKQFGLFMVALLLWYPTFQYTVLYEFDMLRFSIPIILWMLYFWKKGKMVLYFLFVLLAILVREEVGLTIMMFGIYLLSIKKEQRKGLVTALVGLGAFIAINKFIMPSLRNTESYSHIAIDSFSVFGNPPSEIIVNIIWHPISALAKIFQLIKLANVFMLFLPLLFIPLFAPKIMIAILANIGVGMLSASPTHLSYMLYYLSPSVPFIFYAFIKGWPKFLERLKNITPGRYLSVNVNSAAVVGALSVLLVSNVFFGPSPISLQFWFENIRPAPFKTQNFHYSVYRIADHHRKIEKFCKLIPNSAIVSAHYFLFSHLFKKKGTMVFPHLESQDGKNKADYVFFDKTNNGLKTTSPSYKTQLDFDLVEKDKEKWELVKSEDGYFLFKRK